VRKVLIGIAILLLLGVALYFFWNKPSDPTGVLASALNLGNDEKQHLLLNLPPLAGRYPGTVYSSLWSNSYTAIATEDSRLRRGEPLELTVSYEAKGGLKESFQAFFNGTIKANDAEVIGIEISQSRVISIEAQELRTILLQDAIVDLANRKIDPLVITKAFEGIIKVHVKREAQGELEGDSGKIELIKQSGFKTEASSNNQAQSRVTFVSERPMVFAFEAAKVSYVTRTLGVSPDNIKLDAL
jgi:hypothetical protein